MDPNQQDLIVQFCSITGAPASSAQTTLEAAEWDLEAAISLYYAAADGSTEPEQTPQPTSSTPQPQASSSQPVSKPVKKTANSKLRTLKDIQASSNDDDDSEDREQDRYAGGEKSGLAVQNPGPGGPADHFRNILQQAKQNRDRPPSEQPDEEEPQTQSAFSGRAQTLGGDDAESRVIEDPRSAAQGRRTRHERINRTLHLWSDGVSVDDGPLFRFDDPANAHIMHQINQGQAPLSLLDVQPNQEVDLTLEPHKDQAYVQPKKQYKPFSGSGQRLGSPTPGLSTPAAAAPASQPIATSSSAATSAPPVTIDESTPAINLQVRMGDGSRLTSRFNTSHTIGDVYSFVDQSQPTQRAYVLVTTFPTRELSDRTQVLGDIKDFKRGGLVQQKWL